MHRADMPYVIAVLVLLAGTYSAGCLAASCQTTLVNVARPSASVAKGPRQVGESSTVGDLFKTYAVIQREALQIAVPTSPVPTASTSNRSPPNAVLVTLGHHPGAWLQPVVTAYVVALLTQRVLLVRPAALLQYVYLPFPADWRNFAAAYSSTENCTVTTCRGESGSSCKFYNRRHRSLAHIKLIHYSSHEYDLSLLQDLPENKAFFQRYFSSGNVFHEVARHLFNPSPDFEQLLRPYRDRASNCTIGIDAWHASVDLGFGSQQAHWKMLGDIALNMSAGTSGSIFVAAATVEVQHLVGSGLAGGRQPRFSREQSYSHNTAFMVDMFLLAKCKTIIAGPHLGALAAAMGDSKPVYVDSEGTWRQFNTSEPCIPTVAWTNHRAAARAQGVSPHTYSHTHCVRLAKVHDWIRADNKASALQVPHGAPLTQESFTTPQGTNLQPVMGAAGTSTTHSEGVGAHQLNTSCGGSPSADCSLAASAGHLSSAAEVTAIMQAARKPVRVVFMSQMWWAIGSTSNCSLHDVPLTCQFSANTSEASVQSADCLYYHLPTYHENGGIPQPKAFPNQLRLAVSAENPTAGLHPHLDDPQVMCQYDAEMSYRSCSQSILYYHRLRDLMVPFNEELFQAPVHYEDKIQALLYMNGNCNPPSGRAQIMKELLAHRESSVPVHSMGNCDHNTPWPADIPQSEGKRLVQRRYMFCVAMENSIAYEYVSEKLWDSLEAGCIPVYLGTSAALQMIPDRTGVIFYDVSGSGDVSTSQELATLLAEIASNKDRYEAMMAWKHRKPEDQPSRMFRDLWHDRQLSAECDLCRFLVKHRIQPKPRYTTCLSNTTWLKLAGRDSTRPAAC